MRHLATALDYGNYGRLDAFDAGLAADSNADFKCRFQMPKLFLRCLHVLSHDSPDSMSRILVPRQQDW